MGNCQFVKYLGTESFGSRTGYARIVIDHTDELLPNHSLYTLISPGPELKLDPSQERLSILLLCNLNVSFLNVKVIRICKQKK